MSNLKVQKSEKRPLASRVYCLMCNLLQKLQSIMQRAPRICDIEKVHAEILDLEAMAEREEKAK